MKYLDFRMPKMKGYLKQTFVMKQCKSFQNCLWGFLVLQKHESCFEWDTDHYMYTITDMNGYVRLEFLSPDSYLINTLKCDCCPCGNRIISRDIRDCQMDNFQSLHWWWWGCHWVLFINTLRPRQNGCHFADDIFKCIFFNEKFRILNKISLKYVP